MALLGRVVGRLTVAQELPRDGKLKRWLCRCACGNEVVRLSSQLSANRPWEASCGCAKREKTVARNYRHGMAGRGDRPPEYLVWRAMRQRCAGKTADAAYYSDRGITVCNRWADFSAFLADMGRRPSSKHSLDRIDVDGNYEPSNCRWTDAITQRRNQRRYIEAHPEYRT